MTSALYCSTKSRFSQQDSRSFPSAKVEFIVSVTEATIRWHLLCTAAVSTVTQEPECITFLSDVLVYRCHSTRELHSMLLHFKVLLKFLNKASRVSHHIFLHLHPKNYLEIGKRKSLIWIEWLIRLNESFFALMLMTRLLPQHTVETFKYISVYLYVLRAVILQFLSKVNKPKSCSMSRPRRCLIGVTSGETAYQSRLELCQTDDITNLYNTLLEATEG